MRLVDVIHRLKDEYSTGIKFYNVDDSNEYYSYAQLYSRAQKMLTYLRGSGVEKGDEVIILIDNNLSFVTSLWACLLGGFICIPFATNERNIAGLEKCLHLCNRPICVVDDNSKALLKNANLIGKYSVVDYPEINILDQTEVASEYAETEDEDVVLVLFSSGSTSEPKGAAMSNKNLIAYLEGYASYFYTHEDIFLNWLPFIHNAGIVMSHFCAVYLGAEQYLVQPALMMKNVAKMMELITEKRIGISGTIRLHILQLTELAKKNPNLPWDLSSIKAFVIGGEPLSYQEIEEFLRVMEPYGFKRNALHCSYGLSECVSGVLRTKSGKEPSSIWVDRRNMQVYETLLPERDEQNKYINSIISVGEPEPGIEVMIRSKDNTVLGEDQVGIIYLRGKQVIDSYYGIDGGLLKDDEGWLNSEDVGLIHKNELYILGREKNMIFVNSKNVFCDDIAIFVSEALSINKDNLSFVSIPSNDNTKNDMVVCFRIADFIDEEFVESSNSIRKACMEHFGIKINSYIALKEFPHTGIGKVKVGEMQTSFMNSEYSEDLIYRYLDKYENSITVTREALEQKILEIFKKYCDLNVEDNFFDYLHDSMEVAKIHAEVDELYPEVLEIADFFQYYSVKKLSCFMFEQLKQDDNLD